LTLREMPCIIIFTTRLTSPLGGVTTSIVIVRGIFKYFDIQYASVKRKDELCKHMFSSLFEGLILAQGERWRCALSMQVERPVHHVLYKNAI